MRPEQLLALMPFATWLGVRLVSAAPAQVVAEIDWAEQRTAGGGLHGGALMALADSVGGACAFLNLPPGAATATISSNTVFLRGVRSGSVTATAAPLHVGRSTIAVHTELRDADGRLVAQTTQTQAVITAAQPAIAGPSRFG